MSLFPWGSSNINNETIYFVTIKSDVIGEEVMTDLRGAPSKLVFTNSIAAIDRLLL